MTILICMAEIRRALRSWEVIEYLHIKFTRGSEFGLGIGFVFENVFCGDCYFVLKRLSV